MPCMKLHTILAVCLSGCVSAHRSTEPVAAELSVVNVPASSAGFPEVWEEHIQCETQAWAAVPADYSNCSTNQSIPCLLDNNAVQRDSIIDNCLPAYSLLKSEFDK